MSFSRHGKIFPSDGGVGRKAEASAHRLDEFSVGYCLAVCSPAWPASASPTIRSVQSSCPAGNRNPANGNLSLITSSQPRGALQDRLVPIFLATLAIRQQSARITFGSAAEMLDTFGLRQGGSQYRRLEASFQRIFGATIFFGTDVQRERAAVVHRARFNFMTEARIWYSKDFDQRLLPGDCQNMIVLSDEFYREILSHPIPTDLEAAKVLSSSPAALDLFMWLSYRCFTARGRERVPLFGDFGLVSQLGSADYARPRKFREKLDGWLGLVRAMWPACPAWIDAGGTGLLVDHGSAVLQLGEPDLRN